MRTSRKIQMYFGDWLYPNQCPCCGNNITWERYLCSSCENAIEINTTFFCPLCGKHHSECCCGTDVAYDRALVVTTYEKAARSGMLAMKTGTSLHFGWYCGKVLSDRILQDHEIASYDCVVPVPMSVRKLRKRRRNPAQVIGKEISAQTGIPLRTDILWDDGKGKTQHFLSAENRRNNVTQFHVNPVSLQGYQVILCDDILTTGSTLQACAILLKSIGVRKIAVAVAASTTNDAIIKAAP